MEVTAHPGRHGMLCHYTDDEVIGASLAHYGEWAEEELYLLSSFIRPADTVVDVGANIGTHTIAFSRFVGPTGCVLSIDGQRRAFALLTLNTFLNAAENVRCVHAIVGKESGLRMVPEEDPAALRNLGCFSFATAETPATNDRLGAQLLFPLSVIALDELHLPRCELVKIDAEGMELEVMFGAIRTIERFRPVIYFEQTSERSFLQTFEFLQDISYDAFWHVADPFNRNNLRGDSHNIFGGTREVMVLALPRGKRNGLEKSGFVLDEISQPIYNPPRHPAPDPGWALPEGAYRNLPPVDSKRIENLLEKIRLARPIQ
jgi:FkbM family methyltransferase